MGKAPNKRAKQISLTRPITLDKKVMKPTVVVDFRRLLLPFD